MDFVIGEIIMKVHPSTVKCLSWLEDGYEKLFFQASSNFL